VSIKYPPVSSGTPPCLSCSNKKVMSSSLSSFYWRIYDQITHQGSFLEGSLRHKQWRPTICGCKFMNHTCSCVVVRLLAPNWGTTMGPTLGSRCPIGRFSWVKWWHKLSSMLATTFRSTTRKSRTFLRYDPERRVASFFWTVSIYTICQFVNLIFMIMCFQNGVSCGQFSHLAQWDTIESPHLKDTSFHSQVTMENANQFSRPPPWTLPACCHELEHGVALLWLFHSVFVCTTLFWWWCFCSNEHDDMSPYVRTK